MCQWRNATSDEGRHCVWAAPITLTWDEYSDGYAAGVAEVDVEIFDCSEYMGDIKICPLFDVTEMYLQLDTDTLTLTEVNDDGSDLNVLLNEPTSATFDDTYGYSQADFNTVMANSPFENAYKGFGFTGQSSTSKMKAVFQKNNFVAGEGFKLVVKCYPCGWFDAQYTAGQPYTTTADPQKYCTSGQGRDPETFHLRNDFPQPVVSANLKGYDQYDTNMAAPTVEDAQALNWQHYIRNKKQGYGQSFNLAFNTLPPQETIACA